MWYTPIVAKNKVLQIRYLDRGSNDYKIYALFRTNCLYYAYVCSIKLKSDNKAIFCQNFAKLYKINRLDLTDEVTVTEASLFGTLPNGSYGAQMGNDDVIMTCITATEFFNTTDYADFVEELLDFIDPDIHDEMESVLYKDNDQAGDLQYDIYDLLK